MLFQTSPEIGGMGHSVKRKEDARLIQGHGNFVDDVNLPRMVYGQIVRSPFAHARLGEYRPIPITLNESAYYLRFRVQDRPGIIAQLASALASSLYSVPLFTQ